MTVSYKPKLTKILEDGTAKRPLPTDDDINDVLHFLGSTLREISAKLRELEQQNDNVALRPYVDERLANVNDRIANIDAAVAASEEVLEKSKEAAEGFRSLGDKVSSMETKVNNAEVNTRLWLNRQEETREALAALKVTVSDQGGELQAQGAELLQDRVDYRAVLDRFDTRLMALEAMVRNQESERRLARRPLWKRISSALMRR
jgi:chromosome segregation ATPase